MSMVKTLTSPLTRDRCVNLVLFDLCALNTARVTANSSIFLTNFGSTERWPKSSGHAVGEYKYPTLTNHHPHSLWEGLSPTVLHPNFTIQRTRKNPER